LLADTSVSALPTPKGEVIVVSSAESPYDGFKKLISHNILSAPVWDLKEKKYTGFLDMRDLVSFVVFIDDDQKSDVPSNLQELVHHGSKLFKQPLEGVTTTYLSRRNPFKAVNVSDNLLKVVEVLSQGVHRVPVVNEKGEVMNIISQTSIIGFLQKHHKDLAAYEHSTLATLKLGSRPVVSVTKSTKAIEAFRLMDKKRISGVALVDEEGKFIGNTSASDLKLFIKTPSLENLQQPIMNWLNVIRQESIETRTPTISCSPHDNLSTVIGKLSVTKVHRIFVADDKAGYRPVAVVSITDILRHIIKACE